MRTSGPLADRLEQVHTATDLKALRLLWDVKAKSSSTTAAKAAGRAPDAASRISKMASARSDRSTEKVLVQCVKIGGKLRVRVVSDGYDKEKNCQFPKNRRVDGKCFWVDTVVDGGSFYRAKGAITPQ
jgi:hypothetical protein